MLKYFIYKPLCADSSLLPTMQDEICSLIRYRHRNTTAAADTVWLSVRPICFSSLRSTPPNFPFPHPQLLAPFLFITPSSADSLLLLLPLFPSSSSLLLPHTSPSIPCSPSSTITEAEPLGETPTRSELSPALKRARYHTKKTKHFKNQICLSPKYNQQVQQASLAPLAHAYVHSYVL